MKSEKAQSERLLYKTCVCRNCSDRLGGQIVFGPDENSFLPAVLSQYFGFPSLKAQKIPVPSILVSGETLIFNPLLPFEKNISIKTPIEEILSVTKNALIDLLKYNRFHFFESSLVLHSRLFERGGQLNDRFSLVLNEPGNKIQTEFNLSDPERIRVDESTILFDFDSFTGWRFYPFHEELKMIETCELCAHSTETLVDQYGWMPLPFYKVFLTESGSDNPYPVLRLTGPQFRFYAEQIMGLEEKSEASEGAGNENTPVSPSGECHVFNISLTGSQIRTDWLVEILRNQATWKKLKQLRMMVLNSAEKEITAGNPEDKLIAILKSHVAQLDEPVKKTLFR